MSTLPSVAQPLPADLPDWILALKPPDADMATVQTDDCAVFVGLDLMLGLMIIAILGLVFVSKFVLRLF
jgi:hypothetical protein